MGQNDNSGRKRRHERRKAPRFASSHNAACRISDVSYTVEVVDVSRTGAQILVRQGLVPAAGRIVTLTFMHRAAIEATVMWTRDGLVGIRFLEPLADCSDAVHFDDLGVDYYRAVLKFQLASD